MSTTWGIRHRPESPQRPGRHRGPSDTSAIHPGELFKPVGLWTRARVARDSWSTLRALRPMHEWPRRDGRACGPSEAGRSCPGELVNIRALRHGPSGLGRGVDTMGPRARAQDSRDSWSTPQALGPGSVLPGTAARPRGPTDLSASLQGQMFDTEGLWSQAPVARDTWLTGWALEKRPKSCGIAGQHHRTSDPGPSRTGQQVQRAGT